MFNDIHDLKESEATKERKTMNNTKEVAKAREAVKNLRSGRAKALRAASEFQELIQNIGHTIAMVDQDLCQIDSGLRAAQKVLNEIDLKLFEAEYKLTQLMSDLTEQHADEYEATVVNPLKHVEPQLGG